MKKILNEQSVGTDKTSKMKYLSRAIELGCFDNLGATVVGDKPQEREGDIFVIAKGDDSGKDYYFSFAPTDKKDPKSGLQQMGEFMTVELPRTKKLWFCRALQAEVAKGMTDTNSEQAGQAVQGSQAQTPAKEEEVSASYSFKDFIKTAKSQPLKEIPERDCMWGIKTFYDYAQKRKYANLGEFHDAAKEGVERCVKQKNMQKNIEKNKQGIGDMIRQLNAFNMRVPDQAKYRIQTESKELNSLIKKTLRETKEQKKNRLIEQQITESRIKIVLENLENFEKFSKVKKVKVGFNFLRETAYIKQVGLVNENLATIFKSIYGKSLDNTIQTVSEPLLESILTKIGIDDDLKNKVLENLANRSSELLSSMDDCKILSKLLTDVIVEEFVNKLSVQNLVKSDLLNNSFQEMLNDESYKNNLNSKLETNICELFEKFTENARNLVVRMSAL